MFVNLILSCDLFTVLISFARFYFCKQYEGITLSNDPVTQHSFYLSKFDYIARNGYINYTYKMIYTRMDANI